jgi:hypothetical protein
MMVTFVTSMNRELFEEYGDRMISSFEKHSQDSRLIVAFQGEFPKGLATEGQHFQITPLMSESYERFHRFFGRLCEANGLKIKVTPRPGGGAEVRAVYDYKFNLVRYSFKIFSLEIALKLIAPDEPFAWIDADVRCLKNFKSSDLAQFFPGDGEIMSYLGRTHFPEDAPYSECGFLAFNPAHLQTHAFLDRMKALYTTGEAFTFREWHDSWLWDEVRKEFEAKGLQFKNISGAAEDLEHPFVNCGLGEFFDHLKGDDRKKSGHSFPEDFRNKPSHQS